MSWSVNSGSHPVLLHANTCRNRTADFSRLNPAGLPAVPHTCLLLLKISYLCFSMYTSLIAPRHLWTPPGSLFHRRRRRDHQDGKYLTRTSGGGRHFRILSSSNLQLYSRVAPFSPAARLDVHLLYSKVDISTRRRYAFLSLNAIFG